MEPFGRMTGMKGKADHVTMPRLETDPPARGRKLALKDDNFAPIAVYPLGADGRIGPLAAPVEDCPFNRAKAIGRPQSCLPVIQAAPG